MEQVEEKLPLQPGDSINLDVVIMPESSWKQYNNQDKIEPMLIMSYSCQEGEESGYTREISWVTVIKVMPSLEFSNLELFEIERFVCLFFVRDVFLFALIKIWKHLRALKLLW